MTGLLFCTKHPKDYRQTSQKRRIKIKDLVALENA